MCGIMGYVRTAENIGPNAVSMIVSTFKGISERGKHASGYCVLNENTFSFRKDSIPSTEMADNEKFKMRLVTTDMMFGHSRFATSGDPEENINNHPHLSDDKRYILIHNGVVIDRVNLPVRSECDSEKLLRIIEKNGITKGFKKISKLRLSNYAILVIDTTEKSMYAFRNFKRPAVFSHMKKAIGGYLIASTREILLKAALNAGVTTTPIVHEMKPYTLYKFSPGKGVRQIWSVLGG